MIECRPYRIGDGLSVDRLLDCNRNGDVRINRDRIIVAGDPISGCLVWRAGGIVHELRTSRTLGQRAIADRLVDYAISDAIAQPFPLWEAIFITDSDTVADYCIGKGALEESGKRVFTLNLRG